jgi:hypothetical protein
VEWSAVVVLVLCTIALMHYATARELPSEVISQVLEAFSLESMRPALFVRFGSPVERSGMWSSFANSFVTVHYSYLPTQDWCRQYHTILVKKNDMLLELSFLGTEIKYWREKGRCLNPNRPSLEAMYARRLLYSILELEFTMGVIRE